MNEKICAVSAQETLSTLAASLLETASSVEAIVSGIHSKLFGFRPCEAGNEPVINTLEDALRTIYSKMCEIQKGVAEIERRI